MTLNKMCLCFFSFLHLVSTGKLCRVFSRALVSRILVCVGQMLVFEQLAASISTQNEECCSVMWLL